MNSTTPKVSVIIPVFDTAPWLDAALDSVTSQSLADIELIIVDDGSTDESLSIAHAHAARDARITVLTQPNAGSGAARNLGLEVARGSYIYFFDSDDLLKPGVLERLYDTCVHDDLDVCLFSGEVVYDRPDFAVTKQDQEAYNLRTGTYEGVYDGQALFDLLVRNGDHIASTPLLFLRRAYLQDEDISFVTGIIHEDESYVFEVIVRARRAAVINDKLYLRRFRPGSTMTRLDIAKSIIGNRSTIDSMDAIVSSLDPKPEAGTLEAVEAWKTRLRNNITRLTNQSSRKEALASAQPRVSVIVYCKGTAADLDLSLSTLFSQTLIEIEILCIDTCMDSALTHTIEKAAASDRRVKALAAQGASREEAIEVGIRSAQGEFLGFLEAGDFVTFDCYEQLVRLAQEHAVDSVRTNLHLYTSKNPLTEGQTQGCDYQEALLPIIPDDLAGSPLRWGETSIYCTDESWIRQRSSPGRTDRPTSPKEGGPVSESGTDHWKTGYVSGSFDLFHIGHLNLLRHAKLHCDRLIVGVLSDEAIMQTKKKQPVIPLDERLAIVEAIRYVDEVDVTTVELLDKLVAWQRYRFDAMFSGDDHVYDGWASERADLAALGAELVFFPYTLGISTTLIRRRLDEVEGDNA